MLNTIFIIIILSRKKLKDIDPKSKLYDVLNDKIDDIIKKLYV